ncbi:murein hydrolase transporter LrgA [Bacillus sp. V3-13]|uniref:CidA/LrgA family protein n=1 Tax=Bacillus sp. V3-13 TaxID=2053728 RepID=UPI000C7839EF|nr:CidA/LrgA family protein [Bacillus sp. V3-13]PLR78323.1 murein hydrolase transporter LrgA [Bacillus sp. V3-13]
MKLSWLLQLLIISAFLLLGYGTVAVFRIPLPGSVVGMILLFVFLLTGIIKLDWIERTASFQLKHLTLLFIPPIVSLFLSPSLQQIMHWNIVLILVVSSMCCLLGTAFFVEWYEKIKRRNGQ